MIYSKKFEEKVKKERIRKYETIFNEIVLKAYEDIKFLIFSSENTAGDSTFYKYDAILRARLNAMHLSSSMIGEYSQRLRNELNSFEEKYRKMLKKEEELVKKTSNMISEIINSSMDIFKKKEKIDTLIIKGKKAAISPYFEEKVKPANFNEFLEQVERATIEKEQNEAYEKMITDEKNKKRDDALFEEFVQKMEEIANSSDSLDKKKEKLSKFVEKASKKFSCSFHSIMLSDKKDSIIIDLENKENMRFIGEFSQNLNSLRNSAAQRRANEIVSEQARKMLEEYRRKMGNDDSNGYGGMKH